MDNNTTAKDAAKLRRMHINAHRRYGGTGTPPSLRKAPAVEDDQHTPTRQRSPLVRKVERFAIIAEGWIGKLGSATNAAVFNVLCLHANHDGEAWPSKALISSKCYGLSHRSISTVFRALEKIGAITLLSPGTGKEPSHYHINKSPKT